jgi:hypothetical protein
MTNAKPKYVLCGFCNKPIHIDDFAGVINGKFYHRICLKGMISNVC